MPVFEQLTCLVEGVFEHIWHSPDRLAALHPQIPVTPPVPFLGRVDTAVVLTVGTNPSDSELQYGHFPEKSTHGELTQRLLTYFEGGEALADPRLSAWEVALNELGLSYTDGSAAHIEISPRATLPYDQCDPYLFLEMCRYDAPYMFELLDILLRPRVLLMAGSVGTHYPVSAFLGEIAPESDWRLLGDGQMSGPRHFGYHTLCSDESSYDGFFCSADLRHPGESAFLRNCVREQRESLHLLLSAGLRPVETS